jgi:hypothetical protein
MLANLPDLQQLVACEIDPVVRKVRSHRAKNPKPRIPNPTPRSFCSTLNAAQAAEEHFLATWASDPRLTIVGDGLEYARNAGEEGFDLVLVDASEPVVEGDGGGDKGVFAPPRSVLRLHSHPLSVWFGKNSDRRFVQESESFFYFLSVWTLKRWNNPGPVRALNSI